MKIFGIQSFQSSTFLDIGNNARDGRRRMLFTKKDIGLNALCGAKNSQL